MDNEIKVVTFNLKDDEYGFEVEYIREIRNLKRITYIPQAPDFVEGVIKLRGNVIPLINLRKRLGFSPEKYSKYTKTIIVNFESHVLGVIVDSVTEVLTIPKENIDYPDSVLASVVFLKGVGKMPGRMILIVDLKKIFNTEEKESLKNIHKQVMIPQKGDNVE